MPNSASIRAEILLKNYDNRHAEQFEAHKTRELLQCKYFWPRMTENIKRYVQDCKTCNCTKAACHKPYRIESYVLLQLLPAPSESWKDIIWDFITGVPPSLGVDKKAYDAILMVVNRYIKLVKYYPVLKMVTAEQFGNFLVRTVFCSFGVPSCIISHQGLIFMSTFWSAFCHYLRIKRCLNMAFHP